MNPTNITPGIDKLIDSIKERITPEAIEKTMAVFDGGCLAEVLLMATAFRELAEYAQETAYAEIADGFTGEEAQQRADNFNSCYAMIVTQFDGDPDRLSKAEWIEQAYQCFVKKLGAPKSSAEEQNMREMAKVLTNGECDMFTDGMTPEEAVEEAITAAR